ncbi:peptidoglycan D,D-transpeptidase FtsI family protein [Psychrobacter sp. I-STPA6b]|uniref:peptidoglycan D,D-transpeptidase FtsI family protein n=1 Tax=Psychrobacter sp. I-STPA6b TaxID=2585718 RepID=UPI001D0C0D50|nr:penicillin-binding protein 2 [Psychrobacter sp. I-STPA6b]
MTRKKSTENPQNKNAQGKVTKPLKKTRKTSQKKVGSKTGSTKSRQKKSTSSGFLKRLFAKKQTDQGAYTSVKNRQNFILKKASGASPRGSLESDLSRFQVVWGIAIAFLLILLWRAFDLQIANAEFYQQKGDKLITSERRVASYRGIITDRNHLPLAVSAPLVTVSFSPYDYALAYYSLQKEIALNPDKPKMQERLKERLAKMDLRRLASVSGASLEDLQQAVSIKTDLDVTDKQAVKKALPSGSGSHYFPLLTKVTPEIAEAVVALDFTGVYSSEFFKRYYPQPQPNAQLIGFMGQNSNDPEGGYIGRSGIERQYERELAGQDGKILVLNDARRNMLKEVEEITPEVSGENVTLTIDARLQYLLYKELEEVGRVQSARWATGIVVDVHTGEVLALSTWPSFNPNNLAGMTGDSQRNRALIDVFEPGSVMKPFTVAAALDSGKFTEHSLINTSPGSIRIKGYTIRDHGNLGSISLATLLKKSSNVASTKIALSLPPDGISSIQKRFGFGEKTALNFPGEGAGFVPTPKEKEIARRATLSYGYGLQVTLAQIAQAYATLGAGGVMHPLTLVKTDVLPPSRQVLDRDQALSIVRMLESVTQSGGTGRAAAIDGYRIAGKTGTSRRTNPDGGYYSDQHRNVFAGIAPASNPRLVTVILVEDPQKQHYAGQVAAPVFHNVMKEALRLYNVPLDKPLANSK